MDVADLDPARIRESIEARLTELAAPDRGVPPNLSRAIAHALLAPGKRLRPVILCLVAEPDATLAKAAVDLGCAVEMVHTASLILDDLPCMDDARMRRDRVTTHLAFGQATAILGAIALLTRAFGIVAGLDVDHAVRTRLASVLAGSVGCSGLVAGQEIDINGRADLVSLDQIENLNWLKTGTLFVAAGEMGAILRGLPEQKIEAVRLFARHLGLAFQTADDLLDLTATPAEAGKDTLKDGSKATLVSLLGTKNARMSCEQHLAAARAALADSGVTAAPLNELIARCFGPKIASDEG
jgi:geranylgeranyl diphosphate synthase type II